MKKLWSRKITCLAVCGIVCVAAILLSGCGTDAASSSNGAGSGSYVNEETIINEAQELTYTAKSNIDEEQVDKSEVVYAKADASGNVKEVRVDAVLKNHGDLDAMADVSRLTEIRNMEGDEEYTQDGEKLSWENHGEDISYRGTATDELPVRVKVRYELDGKEISPEELIGKSGHVVIHFDYENLTKEKVTVEDTEYEVPVPFIFLSAVTLDEEKFVNVKVSHGKVMKQEGMIFAIGYAIPEVRDALGLADYEMTEEIDLPEKVEIEADVTDFELEFSETIVVNGFFAGLEEEDLEDFRENGDSMDELSDASDKLVSGTKTLYDSMVKYQGYLNQYIDGVAQVRDGVDGLESGLQALSEQGTTVSQGAEALHQGMTAYAGAYHNTMEMVKQYGDALPPELLGALEQLEGSADELAKNSGEFATGVETYTGYVTQSYEGTKQLGDGMDTLASTGSQMKEGMSGLVSGTNQLLDGMRKFDEEGIGELTKLLGDDLMKLLDQVEALKAADEAYINFGGIKEDQTGSVVFMIETEELTK